MGNWGQSVILIYLIASIIMDVMPDEDRKEWKKKYNDFTQIAVVQAYIVSALFWGLIGAKYDFQSLHEHLMNVVVVMVSYFVSEVRFRKRDLVKMWIYGWLYMANTYAAYLCGRDSIYSMQLATWAIFGGVTFLWAFMWCVDQLRWKVY